MPRAKRLSVTWRNDGRAGSALVADVVPGMFEESAYEKITIDLDDKP